MCHRRNAKHGNFCNYICHKKFQKGKRFSPKTEFKKGHIQKPEWIRRVVENNSGEKHHLWKGNRVGYVGLHNWVKRQYRSLKKKKICEKCNSRKNVQFANRSGKYRRNIADWLTLCVKCHNKFDKNRNSIKKQFLYRKDHAWRRK